jgi:hypothetical protein
MSPLRGLVIDVMRPHDPPLVEFTTGIADVDSVAGATATLIERDEAVQNVTVSLTGADIDFDAVEARVEHLGGTVHSVDRVAAGARPIGDRFDHRSDR